MNESESNHLKEAHPTLVEMIFACALLGIAGFAFYSAAIIVFGAL